MRGSPGSTDPAPEPPLSTNVPPTAEATRLLQDLKLGLAPDDARSAFPGLMTHHLPNPSPNPCAFGSSAIAADVTAGRRCPCARVQIDEASGVATYVQLIQQVHQALRVGILQPGDQLPTAQQVVAKLAMVDTGQM